MFQAMFIFWSDALPFVEGCRKVLSDTCDIHADVEFEWSESLVVDNMKRLYQQPLMDEKNKYFGRDKMRGNKIHVFYVSTNRGKNVFHRSAAGEIEYVNSHLMELKSRFRALTEGSTGMPYLVHCAAESGELRLQASLIFGASDMLHLQSGGYVDVNELPIKRNLVGSGGWDSLADAFGFLSHIVNWCVLRGWESLPGVVSGDDLDILVENRNFTFSCLGLRQLDNDDFLRNGYLNVKDDSDQIKFDVHWVGDGYFDVKWQLNVLEKKNNTGSFCFPDEINGLMTALYAEYVARPRPRPDKFERLASLIEAVDENNIIGEDILFDTDRVLLLLSDFMFQKGYEISSPEVRRHRLSTKRRQIVKRLKAPRYKERALMVRALIAVLKVILPSFAQDKLRQIRNTKRK